MKLNGVTGAYGQALNGADIYIVMTVVMLGVSTLGVISFYAQMVLKAAGACTVIFDVIDAEVSVDPNDKGTKVEHGSLQGKYEFKKINFKYPTRPDLHILKDLDIVCEAG
jgi:ABC-type bacteriocin/lantibiotic exporter with double-glycine peptidase domain